MQAVLLASPKALQLQYAWKDGFSKFAAICIVTSETNHTWSHECCLLLCFLFPRTWKSVGQPRPADHFLLQTSWSARGVTAKLEDYELCQYSSPRMPRTESQTEPSISVLSEHSALRADVSLGITWSTSVGSQTIQDYTLLRGCSVAPSMTLANQFTRHAWHRFAQQSRHSPSTSSISNNTASTNGSAARTCSTKPRDKGEYRYRIPNQITCWLR